jgi:hypothetical protein
VTKQPLGGPHRAAHQLAAAVRTPAAQPKFRTVSTKRAFV